MAGRGAASRRPLPRGFGTVWTCVAVDLVGFGIVLPVLPLYAKRFGASPAVAGLLVASFSVAQLLCSPLWGRLSDRIGRRPVIIVSLVGTAVGSLLTGLAGSLWLLFAGRLLDGASGASVSVAQAAVADLADPEDRPRLLGLLGAAFGLGFVAGPAIGALGALVGPAVPFLLAAAIAGVNAVVAWRRLPETLPAAAVEQPARVGASGAEPASGAASAVRSPGGRRSRWRPAPGLVRFAVVAFVATTAFSAFEATFALFGERRLGLRLASTGAVFAAVGVVIVVVQSVVVHRVVAAAGEIGTVRIGLALNALGLVTLVPASSPAGVAVGVLLLTVGQGLVAPALSSAVAGRAGPTGRGAALGVQQAAGGLARVVGPVVGGAVFQHVGTGAPYAVGAVLAALALAVVVGTGDSEHVTVR